MANQKKNIVFDLKNNFKNKSILIDNLKELINSNKINTTKLKEFKLIREKWVKIGKVQSHLSFGLNNSYKHHVKLFYDLIYLDKKIKEKDQEDSKKIKIEIIDKALKIKSYGDKLKAYRELLILIKKWNHLTGPIKANDEIKLNTQFDSIIQSIKEDKKDYLKNRNEYDEKNIEIKKELLEKFKNLVEEKIYDKNNWIKKINNIEKIKSQFIAMGPIRSSSNNVLWDNFKSINKIFFKEKNLFFKKLKKDYAKNIRKQNDIIDECKKLKELKNIKISDLQNLKNKFKEIKNVPFKKNKENWNIFLQLYNECYSNIDNIRKEQKEKNKQYLIQKNKLKDDLKKDFSIEKLSITVKEWSKIESNNSLDQLRGLIDVVKKELKKEGLDDNDIESHVIKVKSALMDESEKKIEKQKLKKKIDDLNKQISQLENNLNFVKKASNNKVLDGVYSDIEKLKLQLQKNEKKYIHIK